MSGINKHVIYSITMAWSDQEAPHRIFLIPQYTQAFHHTPQQRKAEQLLLYCEEGWCRRRAVHNQHNVKGHEKKGLLACANVIRRISTKKRQI